MLIAVPALLALAAVQFPFVREPVEVGAFTGSLAVEVSHSSAVADGKAVMTWSQVVSPTTAGHHLWAANSANSGRSWSAPFRVDVSSVSAPRRLSAESVTVAGGRVQLSWIDELLGNAALHFRSWPVNALPNLPEQVLLSDVEDYILRTSADGQHVAVLARTHPSPLVHRLIAVVSNDGGLSFQPPHQLASSSNGFAGFDFELVGDDLHVVWNEHAPSPSTNGAQSYQFSDDGGATWLTNDRLLALGRFFDPDLAVDGSRVAVVAAEESVSNHVSNVVSTDGGATWTASSRVGFSLANAGVATLAPSAFFTPSHLVVSWSDDRFGTLSPYSAWTENSGVTWVEKRLHTSFGGEVQLAGDSRTGNFTTFWNSGSQLKTKWSAASVPNMSLTFTIAANNSDNYESLRLRNDPVYNDFLCTWVTVDPVTTTRRVWASGFRTPRLEALGFSQGGLPQFYLSGFPDIEAGDGFQVMVSSDVGSLVLPAGDGRLIGLGFSAALQFSTSSPLFRGHLNSLGLGVSGIAPMPLTLPPGTVLYCAAVSYKLAPLRFGSITDVNRVVFQ